MVKNSPARISTSTPSTATTSPYDFRTPASRTPAGCAKASTARSSEISSRSDTGSARLSRVGRGQQPRGAVTRLRLAFTAAQFQAAAGALPRAVPPLHRRAAAQAALDGLGPRLHADEPSGRSRRLALRLGGGCVQEALDLLDALDLARLRDEVVDQLGRVDLAAEHDLAVLGVDVDLALRHVGLAEDLGLDLASEGDVVRLGLRLLAQVRRLLLERVRLRDGALDRPLAVAPDEPAEAVRSELTAAPAGVRVAEVREGGSEPAQPEGARRSGPPTPPPPT